MGAIFLVAILVFLAWSATQGDWALVGVLVVMSIATGGLLVLARRGAVRVAGYAFSLLALAGVVTGAILRSNPGYAPFYMAVAVVLAAVTLPPRDVAIVFSLGVVGELVVWRWPYGTDRIETLGGLYAEGFLLFFLVGVVAVATSSSVARLVGDLWKRDGDARTADERADALALQLERSQRMEALGRLAGGIAHDFNNLLAVMQSCVSMLDGAVKEAEPRADLKDLSDAVSRGAALTRQLLAFSRRDVVQTAVLDLHAVVESMRDLLQRLVGVDVRLRIESEGAQWPVYASPSQLEQVLMNLAINARDAMGGKGELRVRVERGSDPKLGDVCRLVVTDTGIGMTDEVKSRIFEPFFTTKPTGKGTGLGLATVYGVATRLGGHVHVDSSPGHGATFTITLPVATGGLAPEAGPAPVSLRHGKLTVCVVDDEPLLRNQLARILGGAGLTVRTFASAEALLAADGPFDVLVTDVNLPGMSGLTLAEELRAKIPALRIVLVSGFTADPSATAKLLAQGAVFLAKPFEPAALVAAVTATPTPVIRSA